MAGEDARPPRSRALLATRRQLLEDWIEWAIAALDDLDGDCDLEEDADDEDLVA